LVEESMRFVGGEKAAINPHLANMDDEQREFTEKWFVFADDGRQFHRFLMCKGVEWGFQYHNFYGDWQLADSDPIFHSRPHYIHSTMYGGYAHLFHTMDPHYNVPRWVIGPAPGNENGWAFCESDAAKPQDSTTTWISWDGFEWHASKTFRFVPKEHELDGLSDEEDFEDDDDEFAALIAAEDDAPKGGVQKMTAQEYEQQLTNRQEKLDKKKEVAKPAKEAPAAIVEEEEEETPSRPGTPSGKGKKEKKEKKKKGGGLFKKKK